MISPESLIDKTAKIWHPELVNIYGDCQIGAFCNIGCFVEIGPGVIIGDNVSIGAFCFIPSGVMIENDCFIGPGVVFCNDKYPPGPKDGWLPILVKTGAKIGAKVTILPGVTIGERTLVGAGSVVTKNLPPDIIVMGNPARRRITSGWGKKETLEAVVDAYQKNEMGIRQILNG